MSDTTVNPVPEDTTTKPLLSDDLYTKIEFLARVLLPALGVLYVALAGIWHFPYGTEVVGTIVAIDTFLGVFLGVAQRSYDSSDAKYQGTVKISPTSDGVVLHTLVLNEDPSVALNAINLKVVPENPGLPS